MRLNDLCAEAEIPVWHWHGDVAASHKAKLLKNPSGILQITPESLEALLLRKHAAIGKLFGDLRFVVIDEVHSAAARRPRRADALPHRALSRLAGVYPRRIGLSATIWRPRAHRPASWAQARAGARSSPRSTRKVGHGVSPWSISTSKVPKPPSA